MTTNYRALADELNAITERFAQLNGELCEQLDSYNDWMMREFPQPKPEAWNSGYGRHWPWFLYPIPGNDDSSLDLDAPGGASGFLFECKDWERDTRTVILPYLWLEDRERFRQLVTETVASAIAADEQEKAAKAKAARQAKIAAARKVLEEAGQL